MAVATMASLLACLALGLGWYQLSASGPQLSEEFGFSASLWSDVWGITNFAVMVTTIPSGFLCDKVGTRNILLFSGVAVACSLGFRAMSTTPTQLIVSSVLFGLSLGSLWPTLAKAVAVAVSPAHLGVATGLLWTADGIGQALAFNLAATQVTWRSLSIGLATLVVILSVFAFMALPTTTCRSQAQERRSVPPLDRFRSVLFRRETIVMSATSFFGLGAPTGLYGFAPNYFAGIVSIGPELAPNLLSIAVWMFCVSSPLLTILSDRLQRRRPVYLWGALINMVAIAALPWLDTAATLGTALFISGIASGVLALVFVVPLELKGYDSESGGTLTGIALAFGLLGGSVISSVAGHVATVSAVGAFLGIAACFGIAGFLLYLLPETGDSLRSASS